MIGAEWLGLFHFANVAVHAANAVLVFLLLGRLVKSNWPALAGGAALCPASTAGRSGELGDGDEGSALLVVRPARDAGVRTGRTRKTISASTRDVDLGGCLPAAGEFCQAGDCDGSADAAGAGWRGPWAALEQAATWRCHCW